MLFFPMRLLLLLLLGSRIVPAVSYYGTDTCGKSLPRRKPRYAKRREEQPQLKVMGGTTAEPGELPWAVHMTVKQPNPEHKDPRMISLCGGTMISSRHFLTAARCFNLRFDNERCSLADMLTNEEIARTVRIWVGAQCNTLDQKTKCSESGAKRFAQRVAFNRQFFEDGCQNSIFDIALIELNEPVTTPHACLPHLHNIDNFTEATTNMISFGFGQDPWNGHDFTKYLQKIELGTPVDRSDCEKMHKLEHRHALCTKETPRKNVCLGDTGGGILGLVNDRYFIFGINSYGSRCDEQLHGAQVNTDVQLFEATIDKYIRKQAPNYRNQ